MVALAEQIDLLKHFLDDCKGSECLSQGIDKERLTSVLVDRLALRSLHLLLRKGLCSPPKEAYTLAVFPASVPLFRWLKEQENAKSSSILFGWLEDLMKEKVDWPRVRQQAAPAQNAWLIRWLDYCKL